MAKTNKEIASHLENEEWARKWDMGSDRPVEALIRCAQCFYSEPVPGDNKMEERVYSITYDTFKRYDGFCELGTKRPKNKKEN